MFDLSMLAVGDLARRRGWSFYSDPRDPAIWDSRRPLFEHLAATADQAWVAEQDGALIGYARSILRDGMRELTEFFVAPGQQSAGLGRELLARAFPADGARQRTIVATNDERALSRYLRAGVSARFPIYNFRRRPAATPVPAGPEPVPMSAITPEALRAALNRLDADVLGYTREVDHAWLQTQREGFVYYRAGTPVAYGYHGSDCGPFAALEAGDLPALLALAENARHTLGQEDLGFEVPLINRSAVEYLLARGYRMEPFFAYYMSDAPLGRLENYIAFSPPHFL
jgi:hypothetical protein